MSDTRRKRARVVDPDDDAPLSDAIASETSGRGASRCAKRRCNRDLDFPSCAGAVRTSAAASDKDGSDDVLVALRSRIESVLTAANASRPAGAPARVLAADAIVRELRKQGVTESEKRILDAFNSLVADNRIAMHRHIGDGAASFSIVNEAVAARLSELDDSAKLVYEHIAKSGTSGVWVRAVKQSTKLHQAALTKLLTRLEKRGLIKPVKSVAFKNRKMYMLAELQPAKEVTGGVWYRDTELDTEFITRTCAQVTDIMMLHVQRLGGSSTPMTVWRTLSESATGSALTVEDVVQVLDKLVAERRADMIDGNARRCARVTRLAHAVYPPKGALMELRRRGSSRKPADGDADGEEDVEEEEEEDGGSAFECTYTLTPHAPPVHAHAPCVACPVEHVCVPGGVVSPETCVYMSYWLSW